MSNGWQRSVIMLSSSARFICRGKNVQSVSKFMAGHGLRNPIEPIVLAAPLRFKLSPLTGSRDSSREL